MRHYPYEPHGWCQSDYSFSGLFIRPNGKSKENGVSSPEAQSSGGQRQKKEKEKKIESNFLLLSSLSSNVATSKVKIQL